jgi:hypothetical protein
MSTVTEIKKAVGKLPPRKKVALARWMRTQVDERAHGGAGRGIGAVGIEVPNQRKATRAQRTTKEETAEVRRFLSDFDKAVKTIATGVQPTGSIVATLAKMRR